MRGGRGERREGWKGEGLKGGGKKRKEREEDRERKGKNG